MSIPVVQDLVLSSRGRDGESGASGYSGANGTSKGESGRTGSTGKSGGNGEDAHPLQVQLSFDRNDVKVKEVFQNTLYSLSLGTKANIILDSEGGNGGNGGNGGDGGDEAQGKKGADAKKKTGPTGQVKATGTAGKRGGDGGDGGKGGRGGDGGNGGRGGDITLAVSFQDSDLLRLVAKYSSRGGLRGQGGRGGNGGKPGLGGPGGKSTTWTYTETVRTNGGLDYIKRKGSAPGGPQGPSGRHGATGPNGHNGQNAPAGAFSIVVDGNKYEGFEKLYNPEILATKVVDISSGNEMHINEPGETVQYQMGFQNIGGMPTPPQPLTVFLEQDEWITNLDSSGLTTRKSIGIGESFTFEKPITLTIGEDIPLDENKALHFQCRLDRIDRCFKKAAEKPFPFPLRYPLEISPIAGRNALVIGEVGKFSFDLTNIAGHSIGLEGDQKREIRLSIDLSPKDQKLYTAEDCELSFSPNLVGGKEESGSLWKSVSCIQAKACETTDFYFRFKNPKLQVYSTIEIIACLYLPSFRDPSKNNRIIQNRSVKLQLAEEYRGGDNSDLLLVLHAGAEKIDVAAWKKKFSEMALTYSIWNEGLQQFSATEILPKTQKSLGQEFSNKTVVVWNNKHQGSSGCNTTVLDKWEKGSLYLLTAIFRIRVYVAGVKIPEQLVLPRIEGNKEIVPISITRSFFLKPSQEKMKKLFNRVVKQMEEKERLVTPEKRSLYFTEYVGEKLEDSKKYLIGKVSIIPAPPTTQAHLLQSSFDETATNEVRKPKTTFNIAKMLPFSKKLDLLEKDLLHGKDAVVVESVISDLIDEQWAFRQTTKSGKLKRKKLMNRLHLLKQIGSESLKDKIEKNSNIRSNIRAVYLKMRAFSELTYTFLNRFSDPRSRLVRRVTVKFLKSRFRKTLGRKEKWGKEYQKQKKELKGTKMDKRW